MPSMYRGRMLRSRVASVAAILLLVAGCTTDEPSSGTSTATTSPSAEPAEQITLAQLAVEDWPALGDGGIPQPPERPASVGARDYDAMTGAVRTWAVQAATAPATVGQGLPNGLPEAIDAMAAEQTAPALARGNVLGPELEVVDSRMTAAWDVSVDGGVATVALQTRAAYEVRLPDGPVRVVGVLRTQGVVSSPRASAWGTVMGWQEFGADDCGVALDDVLAPGGDADDQVQDLQVFVDVGNGERAVTPDLPDEDRIDADFLDRCRAGRV